VAYKKASSHRLSTHSPTRSAALTMGMVGRVNVRCGTARFWRVYICLCLVDSPALPVQWNKDVGLELKTPQTQLLLPYRQVWPPTPGH